MKILIADDEYVSRKLAVKILSLYGACHTAENGLEALEMFETAHKKEEPFDLITMDILMPGTDGIETLRRIREWEISQKIPAEKKVKVVMLTASKDVEDLYPSFREGCEAYITKPFNAETLAEILNKLGIVYNQS